MTLDEFRRLAECWGGDIRRWPGPRSDETERLAQTPEGEAILAEARELDALLAASAPQVSERRAADAIHAVVTRLAAETAKPRPTASLFRLPRWLIPSAGFACAAMIGIGIGIAYPLVSPDTDAQIALAAILEGGSLGPEWVLQ
ncbi:MAG: hypothetical protein HXY30_03625 [Pseudorhodoplanes sp.]|nr:hypothetical protein [Pseudorhodoplanes sp.]